MKTRVHDYFVYIHHNEVREDSFTSTLTNQLNSDVVDTYYM